MNLLASAKAYKKRSLSVISTDNSKRSIGQWKKYQSNLPSDLELETMFSNPKATGLAVICGAVSGNLEVIDVDCKYGVKWEEYESLILDAHPELYGRLKIIKTKSNGYHIYFRCEIIEGNQKLAERPANHDELHLNPNVKQCVLIETRGEGGYVIAPPSDGYTPLDKNDIPIITTDERDLLFSLARSFNKIIEEVKQPNIPHNNDTVTVWEDYNKRGDIIALLEKHGWSKVSSSDNNIRFLRPGATSAASSAVLFSDSRIFYVHTTSSQFQPKGYNPFGVYTILECNGDYKKAAAQLSDIYGTKSTGWFWSYTRTGSIIIQKYKLQEWLYANNYQLYFHDPASNVYRIISIDNKKVEEVFSENIKKFIKHKLIEAGYEDVMEALMKQTSSIFTDSFFEYIDRSEIKILHDKNNICYFPFKNGIVTVTKDDIICEKYLSIGEYSIWKSQINNLDIYVKSDFNPIGTEFYEFIKLICDNDEERIKYAISIIGYILHSYKDPSKPYAVILAEETDDEAKGGGTGKGIFFKAISKLIPTVSIDGKNFRPDKTFAFQRVSLGTKLVVIEDCPKNVEFERYYPTITEGITIEKKNKDELFLNYSESPKIAFTTNYSISSNAEHSKRRQKVLEFSPYFNSKHTPLDHFGHKLFDDWDDDEWQRFYNFMFYTVKIYLTTGIASMDNSIKLKRKQVKLQFTEDFLDYYDDIEHNIWHGITEEWKSYLAKYELDKKEYSLKRFKKGLQIASETLDIKYIDVKNRQNNNLKEFKLAPGSKIECYNSYNVISDTDLF